MIRILAIISMPFFRKEKTQLYYVHIPRTSGRYINQLFLFNNYTSEFDDVFDNYRVNDISPAHLHFPFYNYYLNADQIPNFTIVRNPIDKIWSALDIAYKRKMSPLIKNSFLNDLENKSFFFDYIDYERSHESYHNNWFMPQINFISNKTHIYKFENGINHKFVFWMNKTLELNLSYPRDRQYPKMKEEILYPEKNKITRKIKNNIKDYYIEDFRKFNY